MAGFEIYFDALENCADRALAISKQFKGIADETPPAVSTAIFGSLSGRSGKLATAVNNLENKIQSEAKSAQENLGKVEAALDQVITNIRRSDNAVVAPDTQVRV